MEINICFLVTEHVTLVSVEKKMLKSFQFTKTIIIKNVYTTNDLYATVICSTYEVFRFAYFIFVFRMQVVQDYLMFFLKYTPDKVFFLITYVIDSIIKKNYY